ncbi:MAG: T9SS type A sorting domain-containing protein [Flavobacteriales bacterium]|nr:T9SS type A sorting domain-containing protein [Flavobacteriales bacterium]
MPIPAQSTTYTGNTRGFWFQAPVDFMMVGVRVPTSASSDDQSVAVVRFNSGAPPFYATTTNDFTLLALYQNIPGNNVLSVSIPVYQGDYIGILGSRGASSTNSYGAGNFSTNILGESVTLARMGMQYDLESTSPQNIWQENANISRVEMYYTTLIIDEYPYCEHFEDSDGNFTVAGTFATWEWGEPDNTTINAASSGDNAWVTDLDGDHNNNELSFVQSPEFDLSPLVDPMVRFQTIRDLQNGTDGVVFQVSTDSGFVWNTLGSASSPSPWYNSSSVSALNALNSLSGWTGSSSGWVDMRHTLATYANDTSVLFRFAIASNGSTTNEGFGFDDIILAESNDIALVDVIYEDSTCGSTGQTLAAVLCNKSIEDKYGFDVLVDTNGSQVTYSYPDTLAICACDTVDVLSFNSSNGGYWDFTVEVDNSGDVNAANDTLSGDILAYEIPGGAIISGAGEYCQGQVIEIEFSFYGTSPWTCVYTNGTSNFTAGNVTSPHTVYATTGGTYEIVSLTDASGCAGDSGTFGGSIIVEVNPNPTPDLGPDTTVCGDYLLDAGPGSTYLWSTGATSQTFTVTNPGTYSVTVTDANGCEGSDVAELDVNPLPIITMADTVLCDGATFLFNAGGPFASYIWDDGSTGQLRPVTTQITVSVTVTDFSGCSDSKSASITEVVDNPTPNITNKQGLAPVQLNAGSGYLTYFWNTGETTQFLDVYTSGTYTCTVTDLNGCKGSDDANTKIWPTSVEDIVRDQGVAVYPNPIRNQFSLKFATIDQMPSRIEMIDLQGRSVALFPLNGTGREHAISLPSDIASGSYVLRVQIGNQMKDIPIVVIE